MRIDKEIAADEALLHDDIEHILIAHLRGFEKSAEGYNAEHGCETLEAMQNAERYFTNKYGSNE